MPGNVGRFEAFKKDLLNINKEYDLDLSLIYHLKFLDRVHSEFFRIYNDDGIADIKPVIQKCIRTVFSERLKALFEFIF